MSMQICKEYPHLKGISADLPQLEPVFEDYISKEDPELRERVSFKKVDFFKDNFPADVDAILFGDILHDWGDDVKKMLIKKSFEALPKGGHILIYDYFLDEDRRKTTDNFLLSLAM